MAGWVGDLDDDSREHLSGEGDESGERDEQDEEGVADFVSRDRSQEAGRSGTGRAGRYSSLLDGRCRSVVLQTDASSLRYGGRHGLGSPLPQGVRD